MQKANGIPLTAPALKRVFENHAFNEEIEEVWDSSFICTDVAAMVYNALGGAHTKLYGFSVEGNPTARFFSEGPEEDPEEGHHFAVVADRFIVDPWLFSVFYEGGALERSVFDLQDDKDRETIEFFYGNRCQWVHIESEQQQASQWTKAFPEASRCLDGHLKSIVHPPHPDNDPAPEPQ